MLTVSYNKYLNTKNPRGRDSVTRLCSDDLAQLRTHLNLVYRCDRITYQVCGRVTWTKCGICNLACCFRSDRNDQTSLSCCIDLHDDNFLGLTRDDKTNFFGTKKKDFKRPQRLRSKRIKNILRGSREGCLRRICID